MRSIFYIEFALGNIGIGLAIGGAIVAGAAIIPICMGFCLSGVAAGIQSWIGNVVAGSLFATLQS